MRYFTADLHIGDGAIAHWRGFGTDVAAHDALVIGGINARVGADDELWILGDVCRPRVADVEALRDALVCEHVSVIIGNHDTRAKFVTAGGFETVDYYAHVGKVRREGYKFVLSHYPMLDWDRAYHGSYMLHGHIHSEGAQYNDRNRAQGYFRYDVGVDANGYRPVSFAQIQAFYQGFEPITPRRDNECVGVERAEEPERG